MAISEPVRWGVLATGYIARKFAADLRALPDARIVAVGSRSPEAAQAFATEWEVPTAHGSWQALADDPNVDIIYLATPHSHHHQVARLCLDAGKALLVEKPITLDLATAQDLVTTARERRLFLMEAMWMLTLPAILRMQEMVADGAIGTVAAIHASFAVSPDFTPEHRFRNPELGGSALLDLGVYCVHFAQSLLGAPHQIRAWARLYPEGTDERTGVVLGFPSGAVATLYCGGHGEVGSATVVGTKGRIEFPGGFFNASRFVLHRNGSDPVVVSCEPAGLHYQAADAGRCLRAGSLESSLIPHETTLAAMRTLDAVRAQIGVVY